MNTSVPFIKKERQQSDLKNSAIKGVCESCLENGKDDYIPMPSFGFFSLILRD
jgi:hypothetical protein